MIDKEIAEIRRRFRFGRNNIGHVHGCFVNEAKEIISEIDQSLGLMCEEDAERILKVMKKLLAGEGGRNLHDVEFSTKQVLEGEEYKLLSSLRSSELKDSEALHSLYSKIIENFEYDGSYMILLANDKYDVFANNADGTQSDESSEVFSYFVCAVCPIKTGKSNLTYYIPGKCFRSICPDSLVTNPEVGFMFPAFDDRQTNIYGALYYTRDLSECYVGLTEALFSVNPPMPAVEQKTTFGTILEETVCEQCDMKLVKAVHGQIREMIETHKEEGSEEPLTIGVEDISEMLRFSGVSDEKTTAFEHKYEEEFGKDTEINPKNIVDGKGIQVKTSEVTIKVNAGCGGVLETRVIDGEKYILIRADGDVEVNGVNIHI